MMSTSPPLTQRLHELLEIVLAAPAPLTANEIAARYGASAGHTTTLLRILRRRGLIAPTKHGKSACWGPKGVADKERAELAKRSKREADQRAQRERRRLEREAAAASAEAWADELPTRRVVPAIECPPLRPQAANSVFNLAHCA